MAIFESALIVCSLLVLIMPPILAQTSDADIINGLNNSSINDPDAVALSLIPYLKDDNPDVRLLALCDIILTGSKRPEVSQAEEELLNEPAGPFHKILELGLQISSGETSTDAKSISEGITPNINAEPKQCSWAGNWSTNWGEMCLQQSANGVTGNYAWQGGIIEGAANGNELIGRWAEPGPGGGNTSHDKGNFVFTMSEDCKSFAGKWNYDDNPDWRTDWTGTQVNANGN